MRWQVALLDVLLDQQASTRKMEVRTYMLKCLLHTLMTDGVGNFHDAMMSGEDGGT